MNKPTLIHDRTYPSLTTVDSNCGFFTPIFLKAIGP
ncbi:uncharacterized protein METZ01_LOCUS517021, partial [marine metagenome]